MEVGQYCREFHFMQGKNIFRGREFSYIVGKLSGSVQIRKFIRFA